MNTFPIVSLYQMDNSHIIMLLARDVIKTTGRPESQSSLIFRLWGRLWQVQILSSAKVPA